MKNKIWLLNLPVIALFAIALSIYELGNQGNLTAKIPAGNFLRLKVWPHLKTFSGWFSDKKFLIRGPITPKNKIVIVDIDDQALSMIGRWPWHREVMAEFLTYLMGYKPKVVGLDIVFSEPEIRIPDEIAELMRSKGLGEHIAPFESDKILSDFFAAHRDRVVLGWASNAECQPAFGFDSGEACDPFNEEIVKRYPESMGNFGVATETLGPLYQPKSSTGIHVIEFLTNTPLFNNVGKHAGFFSAHPDPDGVIRKNVTVLFGQKRYYPSLALEMARIGLGEEYALKLSNQGKIDSLEFTRSQRRVPLSAAGAMAANFRGPSHTFPYVSAVKVIQEQDEIEVMKGRSLASVKKTDLLQDAYILIGTSALGVFDMRSFPFDSNVPGVEGHANFLDNLLSGDMLEPLFKKQLGDNAFWILLALLLISGVLIAIAFERLESVQGIGLFLGVFIGLAFFDQKWLFEKNHLIFESGFFLTQYFMIFVFTIAVKYVLEEKNKKFIKGAFSKYVAPAIVDSILKDPTKLSVGGEKRDLTILFSDIRGFTTLSEKMDAKHLAGFLNDYLGIMTDIVFDHQGTLDKYIGDAVMAFWGAPLDQPAHAANALKAAQRMMQVLAEHQPRFKSQYGVDVLVGIGINSGSVNVGNMGSSRIFEYTVIGDHVNLASRLEGLTKEYRSTILTTRFTMDMIQNAKISLPDHRVLDFVKVKGKKQAVEIIQVLERPHPKEALQVFEEARMLYGAQQWDEAAEKFKKCSAILKSANLLTGEIDGPCEMFIERCEEFKKNPPNADWDGSWEMHSK